MSFSIDCADKVNSSDTNKKTIIKLSSMDFSINCADKVISTHIQLKCNNDLLPHCAFLNTVRHKWSVFVTF